MSVSKVSGNRRTLILFAIALAVVALDQLSKALVRAHVPVNTSWSPVPWLDSIFALTHVRNTGAAFGLFPGASALFMLVKVVAVVLVIAYAGRISRISPLLRVAFGLHLGGAAGNLIDRVTHGYVTDFIDLRVWAVFNIADSAVVIGTALLAYYALFTEGGQQEIIPSRAEPQSTRDPDGSWSEGHGE